MRRRFLCGIIAVISLVLIIFSGCNFERCNFGYHQKQTRFYYGDFVYTYTDTAGSSRPFNTGKYIVILELTDAGKQKDTIIIPEEIDGKPVVQIGMTGLAYKYSPSDRDSKFTRMYLPSTLLCTSVKDYSGWAKVFFNKEPDEKFLNNGGAAKYNSTKVYVAETVYENKNAEDKDGLLIIANLEFIVGDETYWIDDYNKESLITAPEDPVKDGYEFLGWFKESECENKWDFETDKVKGKTYDESGKLNRNITRLYAGWLKL